MQVRQANALKRLFRRNQHLQGIASMDQQINLNNNREENTIASRGDIVRYGSDALIVKRRKELTNENDEDNEGNLRHFLKIVGKIQNSEGGDWGFYEFWDSMRVKVWKIYLSVSPKYLGIF